MKGLDEGTRRLFLRGKSFRSPGSRPCPWGIPEERKEAEPWLAAGTHGQGVRLRCPQWWEEFMVGRASPEAPREALSPRLVGCPASLSPPPRMHPKSGLQGVSPLSRAQVMPCPPDLLTPGCRHPGPNVPAAFSLLTGQDQARPRLRAMRTSGFATEDPSMGTE